MAIGPDVGLAVVAIGIVGEADTETVAMAIDVVAVGFGAFSVGARVGNTIGVDVGLGVLVAVGEAAFSSIHISLNGIAGGGLA